MRLAKFKEYSNNLKIDQFIFKNAVKNLNLSQPSKSMTS